MTAFTRSQPRDGWSAYLDPGERIIWHGRPDGGFYVRPMNWAVAAIGIVFAGFALFWMRVAAEAGGGFWAFGLLHFAVGIGIAVGAIWWGSFKRRRSWYALSNARAFIASELPLIGRRLKSWPITADTPITLDDGALSNVWFASETRRGSKGRSYTVKIGFERIRDGREVYRLMRKVQRGQA
ncbi:MAG: aspartate carbamoyltransferase catalytic subunit [Alphaproteobacteria bacterium]|nr:MAG: aspartate carbamoyltransferase catalytic subunit [Alphaproteobacteria bacterium]